jgi:hypothetical protein
MQVPPEHVSSGGQTLPQNPQLPGSICSLLHRPPHSSQGAGQLVIGAHTPPVHVPEGHDCPQAPQLFGSVCNDVHAPLQEVCPPAQLLVPPSAPLAAEAPPPQMPAKHGAEAGHAVPHAPQLFESTSQFTHSGPHCSSDGGHRTPPAVEMHAAPAHVVPVGQTIPHVPQLFGSHPRFVQPLGHSIGVIGPQVPPVLGPPSGAAVPPVPASLVPPRVMHAPDEHTVAPVQAMPHPPQFIGSICSTVHTPPQ